MTVKADAGSRKTRSGTGHDRAGLDELAADISTRCCVPERSAEAIGHLTDAELRKQVESTNRIWKTLTTLVASSMTDESSIATFTRELDPMLVSRDHDWRGVFQGLRDAEEPAPEHQRLAVRGYLQYLSARKELLEAVSSRREAVKRASADTSARQAIGDRRRDDCALVRLKVGEPVTVQIPYRGERRLWLGRHAFRLEDGYPPYLVDPKGVAHALRHGRQTVGRSANSDIVVDRGFRDVSRAHMVIEWEGRPELVITDLSSRGSFVEPLPENEASSQAGSPEPDRASTECRTSDVVVGEALGRRRPRTD